MEKKKKFFSLSSLVGHITTKNEMHIKLMYKPKISDVAVGKKRSAEEVSKKSYLLRKRWKKKQSMTISLFWEHQSQISRSNVFLLTLSMTFLYYGTV